MTKLIQYFHRSVITLLCLALIIIMMAGAAHFIYRQHTQQSEELQNITHRLIRQAIHPLGPLINGYNTADDNTPQITSVLQRLSQQPWVIDIAVYQLNGALIARAGENASVKERLALDSPDPNGRKTIQLVEKIDLMERPVGFIRLTLDPTALQLNKGGTDYTIKMIWFILILAVSTGIILALTLKRWPDGAPAKNIANSGVADQSGVAESPQYNESSLGNIK